LRELQCTVIVLSATLTGARRRELLGVPDDQPLRSAYPMISGMAPCLIERECEPPPPKTVHIRGISGAVPLREVLGRARRRECVLWIRNTVDEAQETYRQLRDADFEDRPPVALLHSRFPFFRREELEGEWMEKLGKDSTRRPTGCVLVSTQVAEQSVDIDAGLLITDLAPTDMLLQRLGRLWRHDRFCRPYFQPEVWIQIPLPNTASLRAMSAKELRTALGKSSRVYAPYVLLRSLDEWRNRARITLPGDIREILEATYANAIDSEPAAWRELREEMEREKERMAQLALSATAVWSIPYLQDEEGIQTRYSNYPTVQLLLAHEITRLTKHSECVHLLSGEIITIGDRDWDFNAAKAIHRNLVRVPRWAIGEGLSGLPPGLRNHVSQSTAVGLLQTDGSIRLLGQASPTRLAYETNQGIIIERQTMGHTRCGEIDESYD
jgi:CRISPR-associated endonuclease/helicase Cas3